MSHNIILFALALQSSNVFAVPCSDSHRFCAKWATTGACETNRGYMLKHCAKSCGCERLHPDESSTTTTATTEVTSTTLSATSSQSESLGTTGVTSTTLSATSSESESLETTGVTSTTLSATSGTSQTEDVSSTSSATTTESSTEPESSAEPTSTESTSALPPSTTTEVESTRPASEAPTCGQYQRKENTDLAGIMLKKVRASSFDACCSECDATAGCDGFIFFARICYLKTQLQGTFPKAFRTTFIRSSPVESGQCLDFGGSLTNLDLAGILVKPPIFATEQEVCCKECDSVPECEGFAFFRNFCYLKGQLQGTYPKAGCQVQVKASARRLLGDEFSSGSSKFWV